MDHDQQTWTTDTEGEYIQYCFMVAGDAIAMWSRDFSKYL